MPFNVGLLSPSLLLAGSRGANRRGRTGCAMVLSIHTPFGYRVVELGLIREAEVRSLRLFPGRIRMPIIVVAAVEGTPAVFASSHHRHWLVWPTVVGRHFGACCHIALHLSNHQRVGLSYRKENLSQ
jgi:hypothetical protein